MNAIAVDAVNELRDVIGVTRATALFGLARSSYYYEPAPPDQRRQRGGGTQPNALSERERQDIRDVLHSDVYVDKTPYDVHSSLLDEGRYLGSIRTFYRILENDGESTRRQRARTAAPRPVPVLCADKPKEIWSWDITPLASTKKGAFLAQDSRSCQEVQGK